MSKGYVISSQPGHPGQPGPPGQPGAQSPFGNYQMMNFPGQIMGCPPGLEYLTAVDQLICKQEVELFEALTGFECKNKYRILNSMNQQAYWAFEESSLFQRLCCGPQRGFTIHITDNNQQEVMRIERPFKCCTGCCWCADGCCKYPIYVKDGQGQLLGIVRMMDSCCMPHFGIFDADERPMYELWGPCCPCQCVCGCTADVKFPIVSVKDGQEIGNVSKIWAGVVRDMFTDADTFGVTFPMDLDVRHKALMIGMIFCVDFTIFERQNNNN